MSNITVLIGQGRVEQGLAGAALVPGKLVSLNSAGKYVTHGTSGGVAEKVFVTEAALVGKGLNDTSYGVDEVVALYLGGPGDEVRAFLNPGQNASVGALLASAGNGNLKVWQTGEVAIAVALQAMNLTASGSVATRISVRLL
jgi:hypothetical protein